jgi:hypothetical protein
LTHHFALGILEGRCGQRDVDQTSILAPTNGLIVIDLLAAPDALQNPGLVGPEPDNFLGPAVAIPQASSYTQR